MGCTLSQPQPQKLKQTHPYQTLVIKIQEDSSTSQVLDLFPNDHEFESF